MAKEIKIKYEPHPVSLERKKELREKGYTIVDAIFKPTGDEDDSQVEPAEFTPEGIDRMSKSDLRELLEAHGCDIPEKIGEMRAMLKKAMFVGE